MSKGTQGDKTMKRQITIEWKIQDTRKMDLGVYQLGTSTFITESKDAINDAIVFASHIPTWEFERNRIDLNEYRDEKISAYHYITMISRIVKVEVVD